MDRSFLYITNIQPHIWNAGNWVSEGFWTSVEGLDRENGLPLIDLVKFGRFL